MRRAEASVASPSCAGRGVHRCGQKPTAWLPSLGAGDPMKRPPREGDHTMDWKIELIFVPVSDVDRAKEFYVEKLGFNPDHDRTVREGLRFVQLTPPGSACSIAIG